MPRPGRPRRGRASASRCGPTRPRRMPPRRAAAASSARRRCDSAVNPRRTSCRARTMSPVASTASSVSSSTPRCQAVAARHDAAATRRAEHPPRLDQLSQRLPRRIAESRAGVVDERGGAHARSSSSCADAATLRSPRMLIAMSGNSSTDSMPAPTRTRRVGGGEDASRRRRSGHRDDDRQSRRPEERDGEPVAPTATRSARRASRGGRGRGTAATSTSGSSSEQDRVVEQRGQVEGHPGVDEEDRHEEAERDGLDLALDGLAVGLVRVAHDQPPHDPRGERAEQHVEIEHDAQRDQRRQDQEHDADRELAGRVQRSR